MTHVSIWGILTDVCEVLWRPGWWPNAEDVSSVVSGTSQSDRLPDFPGQGACADKLGKLVGTRGQGTGTQPVSAAGGTPPSLPSGGDL